MSADRVLTNPCGWPLGCIREGTKVAVFHNVLNQHVELVVCDPHLEELARGDTAQGMYDAAVASAQRTAALAGTRRRSLFDPMVLAAFEDQRRHAERCRPCSETRDHIIGEIAAGRVATAADQQRIGLYVLANCCAEGQRLAELAGRAQAGL